ncbi:class I histocompatibility antigen, F10 alpha chain-like [Lagopus leucura]|uniref:class I histocompatibility antigen, F10 alpha chain-like n=1 Tax=Lagopus leucura TaxID=30410 RepID=UPI001C66581C|nr:class I histocompatibility antigen, F10 alpha chain-like [Lagopus leucura]
MGPCGALGLGLLLLGAVRGAAGEPHSLRYYHTTMDDPGPGLPWFVEVGYVDGEIFVHYDSTARRYVPRTEWVKAAGAVDPGYWERNTQIAQSNERVYRVGLNTLQERFNQSGGSNTVQRMCGCDILEDGTTRGYHQYAYDGRDFIAFDKDTRTFSAAVPEAVPTKRKWEVDESVSEGLKHYLEETCVQWLRRYVEHGKAELGRRERPEVRVQGKEADGVLTLSCRAHGFYPRPIAVEWMKDGAAQHQDTHTGGVVPNSDGTYHTWVTIDVRPEDRDKYQCRVQHASLQQPGLYSWEPSESNLVPIVVGLIVAIVAIVAGVGFAIYRSHAGKKEKGYSIASAKDGGSNGSDTGAVWGWGLEGVPVLSVVLTQGWAVLGFCRETPGTEGWDGNAVPWDTISSHPYRE